jgi:hypothetical protein
MALIFRRFAGWFMRHKRRIQEVGLGLILFEAFNRAYNYGFYSWAQHHFGFVMGSEMATGLSVVVNALVYWAYDHMKIDWLGAEVLRQLEDKENKTRLERLAVWIGKADKTVWEKLLTTVVFVGLLYEVDPVIVAVHFQRQHFKGLTFRDWAILTIATLVANAWWAPQVGVVVATAQYLWHHLVH